jgi:hypothetical protein
MTDPNTPELSVLAEKLSRLEAQLDDAVLSARHKSIASVFVTIVVIALVACYLWFGYTKYSTIDPTFAAEYAHGQVSSFLPTAAQELQENLKTDAPRAVDNLQAQAQDLPGQFADELKTSADAEMDKQMPVVQQSLYQAMKDKLVPAPGASGQGDQAAFQAQLDTLTLVYKDETIKLADQVHSDYVSASGDPLTTLQTLADNKNLTPREQIERQLLRDGLTLKRFYDADGGKTPTGASAAPTNTAQAIADAPTTMPMAQ